MDRSIASKQTLLIIIGYLSLSFLWYIGSSRLLSILSNHLPEAIMLDRLDFILFVLLTTVMLYLLIWIGGRGIEQEKDSSISEISENISRFQIFVNRTKDHLPTLAEVINFKQNGKTTTTDHSLSTTHLHIRSIAKIQSMLINSPTVDKIPFHSYLNHFKLTLSPNLTVYCDEMQLSVQQALPFGLLINEFITLFGEKEIDNAKSNTEVSITIKNANSESVKMVGRLVGIPSEQIENLRDGKTTQGELLRKFISELGGSDRWIKKNGHHIYQLEFKK